MEWVTTTAKSVDAAKELALEELGVAADEADFEIIEEPRPGLFGRMRGEARVRARVRPTPVRPKQDRRRGRGREAPVRARSESPNETASTPEAPARRRRSGGGDRRPSESRSEQGVQMTDDVSPRHDETATEVDVERVRDAALEFVGGLTGAFGFDTTIDATVEGIEIDVRVSGESLGLLIGPGGRTLLGIQDLARVAAQRRLGDHATRLRVDVAGYREKRRDALARFASTVADQVRASGVARSLDAMPSADRKVLHDALAEMDGVSSHSEGEEPNRRVVVSPA